MSFPNSSIVKEDIFYKIGGPSKKETLRTFQQFEEHILGVVNALDLYYANEASPVRAHYMHQLISLLAQYHSSKMNEASYRAAEDDEDMPSLEDCSDAEDDDDMPSIDWTESDDEEDMPPLVNIPRQPTSSFSDMHVNDGIHLD